MDRKILATLSLGALLLFACGGNGSNTDSDQSAHESASATSNMAYAEKTLSVHRDAKEEGGTFGVRFYESTPHVPYISVSSFYREFFKIDAKLTRKGNVYTYEKGDAYLKFDTEEETLGLYDPDVFSAHPDFSENTSKTFMIPVKVTSTPKREKIIALKNYAIDIHGDQEAYVPLGLLSSLSGGLSGYNVAYNGEDIYVLDSRGALSHGEKHGTDYFGDAYSEPIFKRETREADLAQYAYAELCLNFDNYRGYTTQLSFGDNNLLSLGLNGLLERYHPEVKQLLLSTDTAEYVLGLQALFGGLDDGGHTVAELTYSADADELANAKAAEFADADALRTAFSQKERTKIFELFSYQSEKRSAFPGLYSSSEGKTDFYAFDEASKTAYIAFDAFEVNLAQWDAYYSSGMKEEDIPSSHDSFAFVRSSLYQALEDKAENVVLDLSTNSGGNSGALMGVYGLFNKGEAVFESNNILTGSRNSEYYYIDINLDGVYDEKDVAECNKFASFSTAILTSGCSFSCGNLLPSIMKEIGYKIVGQRSGGGSCAIAYETTVDGISYYRSSHHCLSNAKGENIDGGVEPDFEIEIEKKPYVVDGVDTGISKISAPKFYDYATIAGYLNSLKAQ